MRLAKVVIASLGLVASTATALAVSLTPEDAASHVGESATVCGLVASATYASRSKGEPTFLNLGKAHPNQVFTVVIFGSDRAKFGTPETQYRGRRICATGDIRLYGGKPEIVVHDPKQLSQP
jgi:hypothetical protein